MQIWSNDDSDDCFFRSDSSGINLRQINNHLSMSHIVGRELPVGTVCIFSATSMTEYDPKGTETTNCTVQGNFHCLFQDIVTSWHTYGGYYIPSANLHL